MNAPANNIYGKDTKNNGTTGGKFTLLGLKQSIQPKAKKLPAHDELLKMVAEKATPFDFVEYAYQKDTAKDDKNNHVSELRRKAQSGDEEAVGELSRLEKNIKTKDFKVYTIEHFIETFKDIRFCSHSSIVYAYNGAFWQMVKDSLFSQFLGKIAGVYGVPGTTPRDEDFQTKLLKQFHAAAHHPTPTAAALANLNNGTLRIDSHGNAALGAFDWREFVRYQLPYNYNPEATAPKLQKFLDEVLPDRGQQAIIFEFLGSCFAPGLKTDDKILLCYGEGANGKSVLWEVVTALFGSLNVSNVGIDKLTQSGQAGEFAAAPMDGKLLNFATELDGKAVKSDLFKQLASREIIKGCFKHKDNFDMKPPRIISNCNELPNTGARDLGYYRRFMILHFGVTIPPDRQNTNLAKELIETELPGFLNLILAGLQRLIRNDGHFTANPQGDKLVNELWIKGDSVKAFVNDCFSEDGEESRYRTARLYKIYKEYCSDNNRTAGSNQSFYELMAKQPGFSKIKSGGNEYFICPRPLLSEYESQYGDLQ